MVYYGAASLLRSEFSGSSDQREDHLHQSGIVVLIAGFEPAASDLPSQRSSPDLYQHVMEGGTGFEPMYNGIKIRGLTRLGEPPIDMVPVPGFEPGTFRLSVECSTN